MRLINSNYLELEDLDLFYRLGFELIVAIEIVPHCIAHLIGRFGLRDSSGKPQIF